MRKLKTCRLLALPVRSLLIVAGALLLMAAFAPSTNADVIAYYNFEDSTVGASPPDFTSEGNIAFFGVGSAQGDRPITTNLLLVDRTVSSTDTTNKLPQDPDPSLLAMGLTRSGANSPATFD